ncbi:hypothetical protein [Clostridium sp. JN-1]|uniref:hypothetical protein n=1 Tax=Clostridium sp. JN-1 TaxID=2483110 RepID=UPI000F0BD061|nr:hypothetical protein [Clostridium sp. JN-1]
MSQYQIDINGKIRLMDYSSIDDYMAIVNENDNLLVTFDDNNDNEAKMIYKILEKNRFNVVSSVKNPNGKYYINATKKYYG